MLLPLASAAARLTVAIVRAVALETVTMSDSVPSFTARIQLATHRVRQRLAAPPAIPEGAEIVTADELTTLRVAVEELEIIAGSGPINPLVASPGVGEVVEGGAVVPAAQPGQ